jgi:putative transposase
MLCKQIELYNAGKKHLSRFDMIKLITPLKNDGEHEWLYDVSNTSLQIVCSDLNESYQSFFKRRAGLPKFKSQKKSKLSFPIDTVKLWFDGDGFAHIIKIGRVKFKTDFCLPTGKGHKFSNARISNTNGKWMLSFGMECENQAHTLNDYNVGIDLGIKDSAVVAYDDNKLVFHNINKSKNVRSIKKRIAHLQRSISRKYDVNKQGNSYIKTKNIEREEAKLRKLYAHLSGIRSNYIHQSTHTIVSLLPKRVVMEDLNVTGMMKNRHLSKVIQEQSFYEWIRQLRYKCEWNGIEFVQVDRFYPSSKTCHACGCVNHDLKLKDRIFVCDECGYSEDRDYNAALNLMSYGN